MGRKSSITTLDAAIRGRIDELLKDGRLTLDQILGQIQTAFPGQETPSRSALGRYSQRFEEVGERLRKSREVARVWVDRLGKEPEGDVAKLAMEFLRTAAFNASADAVEDPQVNSKELATLALALQRLETAGKFNLQREQAMRAAVLEEAATRVETAAKAQGMDKQQATFWRQQVLGAF